MTIWNLTAIALGPIHVGDGTTWTPEAFRLSGDVLERFEPTAVVADFTENERREFLKAARSNVLAAEAGVLRRAVKQDQVLERIAISAASRIEVDKAINRPSERHGRVSPFIRTHKGPLLPGSALKGAIRTALLNARLRPGDLGPRARGQTDALQQEVLKTGGETDRDPFRFVAVGDAAVAPGVTRVERVFNRKRRDGETNDMQMHFECLLPGSQLAVTIAVDDTGAEARRKRNPSKSASVPIRPLELARAINGFYRGRWEAEERRFYADADFQRRLNPVLARIPAEPDAAAPVLLVRVGRFSHFESASVDGLRSGLNIKAKSRMSEGTTRMIVKDDRGNPLPFGWLLLGPSDWIAEHAAPLFATTRVPAAGPAPRGGAPQPPARPAEDWTGRKGMDEGGDSITIIEDRGARLLVRYRSGTQREIDRTDFETED